MPTDLPPTVDGHRSRRFNELQRLTPGISHKVLTQTVRHLEANDLIIRTVAQTSSPSVSYELSVAGQSVRPILDALVDWGNARLDRRNGE